MPEGSVFKDLDTAVCTSARRIAADVQLCGCGGIFANQTRTFDTNGVTLSTAAR